ncbi:hypothetical protein [[Mycobacterium] wendilense]|uniref:Thioesterase n=1 Tax=[Mycobacterium] wendilense TaxID=3064284 RepID=A0ABN9P3G8_9MYCO|nr:hypothetical protein [Mycolicibacterium sp. MU0050]CAJ1584564.1 hypothetical protein MU0050_003254 [Mycolicibacterium sp. MU0050]
MTDPTAESTGSEKPLDIRELADDPAAYAAELDRRWGGLLSYRYLGRRYASMDLGPVDDTVAVRHDMRDPSGGLLLSVLGVCSPEGGLMNDLEAVPNPVIHHCQILDPGVDVARFEVRSEGLARGRRMAYSRSTIVDANHPERVLATTEGQGVSIGVPPDGLGRMAVEPIEVIDSPDLSPLWQVFGAERVASGHWRLPPLTSSVASPDAALHIGPQFVALEAAARDTAAAQIGVDTVQGVSSHVMFLARGKVGPFRISTAVVGGSAPIGVRADIFDDGAQAKLITSASYLFRPSG